VLGLLADATTANAFHVGVALTAFGFGFRHGIDWDHIAALTDITGSQDSPRRSIVFATLYAVGHALVVFVLGFAAIVLAERLPDGVDAVMERVVGATLVLLGVYVFWALVRHRRDFRMRSRWMLLFSGVRRGVRWLGGRDRPREVVFEHDHEHSVDEAHDVEREHMHDRVMANRGSAVPDGRHRHRHRHVGRLPDDPFVTYGPVTAFSVGMMHGVGAETPTQVLIFLTAAGAGDTGVGLLLLGCFLVGLLSSNTMIAVAGTFGLLGASRRWWLYATVSVLTAVFSLVIGGLFLFGRGAVLPAIFGG
jgi:ABC-type nickel/cobalt efflux system permease component RcnA